MSKIQDVANEVWKIIHPVLSFLGLFELPALQRLVQSLQQKMTQHDGYFETYTTQQQRMERLLIHNAQEISRLQRVVRNQQAAITYLTQRTSRINADMVNAVEAVNDRQYALQNMLLSARHSHSYSDSASVSPQSSSAEGSLLSVSSANIEHQMPMFVNLFRPQY